MEKLANGETDCKSVRRRLNEQLGVTDLKQKLEIAENALKSVKSHIESNDPDMVWQIAEDALNLIKQK